MDSGWVFPIVCITMMVLCFLMMAGRRGRGGCVGWRLGHGHRSREGDTTDDKTALRNEAERIVSSGGDAAPPVVPR